MPNNLTIQIAVQGGRDARAALSQIARAVRETANQTNEAGSGAARSWAGLVESFHRVREGARIAHEGFSEVHKSLGELKNAMNEMTERVAPRLKEALGLTAAAAAGEFVEAAKSAAESVHQLKNAAETYGMTVKELQQIKFAGGLAGVDAETTNMALSHFARSWGELSIKLKQGGDAAKEAKKQLALLGLSGTDTAGKIWTAEGGPAQTLAQFQKFAEAIARIEDPLKRDAASVAYFGRSYAEIMPLVSRFTGLMGESGKILDQYHLRIGPEEEEAAHKFMTSFTTMSNVLSREKQAIGNILGTALEPVFVDLYDTIGRNTESILKFAEQLRDRLMPVIHDFITLMHNATGEIQAFDPDRELHTDVVKELYSAFVAIRTAIIQAKNALEEAGTVMMSVLNGLAAAVNNVFGTEFTGQGLAAILLIGRITGAWTVLAAAVGAVTAAIKAYMAAARGAAAIAALPAAAAGPIAAAGVGLGALTAGGIAGQRKFEAEQGAALRAAGTSPEDVELRYGGGGSGMATGGSISGPSGRDRVPIWATTGEFIMKTAAVARYGRGFMESLNAMHYASGGFVGDDSLSQGLSPGLTGQTDLASAVLSEGQSNSGGPYKSSFYDRAQGVQDAMVRGLSRIIGAGAVKSLTEGILPPGISAKMLSLTDTAGRGTGAAQYGINLNIDGKTFHLQADASNGEALINFARLRRLVSAGRLPSSATS